MHACPTVTARIAKITVRGVAQNILLIVMKAGCHGNMRVVKVLSRPSDNKCAGYANFTANSYNTNCTFNHAQISS